ncbi:MAG TPA: lysophospholipid acyltransferase family protein [Gemmataceae bacterium]|jgi:1-acyl-sn-glycerol-3-phosphate acyltransferase|nr:lysophospholipid acyltransferase family protein [Gemmataceae bacterium]
MWNAIIDTQPADFWPPRTNRFWRAVLDPWRALFLRHHYRVTEVRAEGTAWFHDCFAPGDGVLIAPNHSDDSDPLVMMEVGRQCGVPFHFMAAWQLFRPHWGLDGFFLKRMGVFSVDREGIDRRAFHQATELLTAGRRLVVFPEGEVYHLNDRLTPLLDGVAFMALNGQRELNTSRPRGRVWLVPAAIRYRYVEAIGPRLETALTRLENRLRVKSPPGTPLAERVLRYGEHVLAIKEKECFGRCRDEHDLPRRISRLTTALLERHELTYLGASPAADTVPLRAKALRRRLLGTWTDKAADDETRRRARAALDDVQLAMQAYSYPGDYISESPTVERIAETIEKLEEDILGRSRPKGRRSARVLFGEPIDLSQVAGSGRPRLVAAALTDQLATAIKNLMSDGSVKKFTAAA